MKEKRQIFGILQAKDASVPELKGQCDGGSTFLCIVHRRVLSLQALVQYVKHFSTQINENQWQSPRGHCAWTEKVAALEVTIRCRCKALLSLVIPAVKRHW